MWFVKDDDAEKAVVREGPHPWWRTGRPSIGDDAGAVAPVPCLGSAHRVNPPPASEEQPR
jgi:hypothetical protein